MGWGRRDLEMIDWGGVLHDLGKVGISDSILNKPGKLTDEEFAIMKSHPSIGAQIIGGIAFLEPLMPFIAQHHERYDGRGYPAGFKGEEIAIQGRLLAIADTYDAMTSDRPYRKGLAAQIAYDEIVKCSGSQFDPVLVRAFEKAFKAGKIV
jgi:HD-GYP domain-containing protein (c-di-GMP phosphodiesterase class II)